MKTTFATLATLALASAAPQPRQNTNKCKATPELATFDTLKTIPAAAELSPVGMYDGLKFNSLDVLQAGVAGDVVVGLIPQSGSQVAVFDVTNGITTGNPSLVPASPYKSFSLESTYFGCSVDNVVSALGVPTACTVSFTAYKPGKNVAFQTINEQFNPTNLTLAHLTKATFPDTWAKMGKIEIAVVQGATTSATTALLIDNVKYDLYKC